MKLNLESKYSFPKLLGAYIVWWLFWSAVQIFVLHRLELDWSIAIIDSVVTNIILAIIVFVTLMIYRFYQPGRANRIYRFIWGLTITVIFCVLLKWILFHFFSENKNYLDFVEKSIPIRFIYALLTVTYMTLFSWLWSKLSEQKENDKRQSDFEKLVNEAELTKLRQQLQPHFLFNSLNSISALTLSKPEEARKMIQQLSDFLRGTLKNEKQSITLSEELEHLRLYLEIEKVRFGHRLSVLIDADAESRSCQLPSLLLQPIVENAIKFGLYDVSEEITISVKTKMQGSNLIVEVKNPFDPQTQDANKGVGFGLSSIARRLYLLYARNDLLTTKKEGTTFITTLKIPKTA
jgi:two-component system LytT family sensor kinase